MATKMGHPEIVDKLLAAGSVFNAASGTYDGRTALQATAVGENIEIVGKLLAARVRRQSCA